MRHAWDRLPFIGRLLLTASFALLVAGLVMLLVSAREEARDIREDLAAEMDGELLTLPAALAEVVVIGDFSSIQQALDRIVQRPHVYSAAYTDRAGGSLKSEDRPRPGRAPAWFESAMDVHNQTGRAEVAVGGRVYGELSLVLNARDRADRAWDRLLHHLAILLLAVGLDFLGIWLILRGGLAPLQRLEQGAYALAAGRLDTRLKAEGGPEMRHLIQAFNRMAQATQESQRALARSNAELLRFADIASHHLQEPARRIASYSDRLLKLLPKEGLDEETRLALDFIQTQSRRQQSLVRDVQRYLAAGDARGEIAPQDAARVAREALSGLRDEIQAAGAEVELGDLPTVTLDRPRLAELFTLLLENSLRHGGPGPLRIRLSGEVADGKTRLQVADSGVGIPREYRERVLRVFERLHNGRDGTGIGLAIARRIAESAGGRIWIAEADLGGCAAWVEFPRNPSESTREPT